MWNSVRTIDMLANPEATKQPFVIGQQLLNSWCVKSPFWLEAEESRSCSLHNAFTLHTLNIVMLVSYVSAFLLNIESTIHHITWYMQIHSILIGQYFRPLLLVTWSACDLVESVPHLPSSHALCCECCCVMPRGLGVVHGWQLLDAIRVGLWWSVLGDGAVL